MMTLVWTVENQDAAAKWFRVTPKPFENRDGAIEWCNTLRERWAQSGLCVIYSTPGKDLRPPVTYRPDALA